MHFIRGESYFWDFVPPKTKKLNFRVQQLDLPKYQDKAISFLLTIFVIARFAIGNLHVLTSVTSNWLHSFISFYIFRRDVCLFIY